MSNQEPLSRLTPEAAVTTLTLPLFHVLRRTASVSFPNSTSSRPSPIVRMTWKSNRDQVDSSLPCVLDGFMYRQFVEPILKDVTMDGRLPINALDSCRFKEKIAQALRVSFSRGEST